MKEFEATNIDEAYALDWIKLAKAVLVHADQRILRYLYGGHSAINAKSAEDFAYEAIKAFWAGDRKWNPIKCPNVFWFLCGAVNSLIHSAANRKDNRLTCSRYITDDDGDDCDILESIPDESVLTPAEQARVAVCAELLTYLKTSINDPELEQLLTAYELGALEPQEVEELTGIPARRVSELKRKLQNKVFSLPETEKFKKIIGGDR